MEHLDKCNNGSKQWTIKDLLNDFNRETQISINEIPSIYNLLQDQRLTPYFTNIEKHLNYKNIVFTKKYQPLRSGLYILLNGHISFMTYQQNIKRGKHIRKQTDHNSKTGNGSINIEEPFFVFQSNEQNCVTMQDSLLLYVKEQQALSCKFYELYQIRMDLLRNYYISKDHENFLSGIQVQELMNINQKLHSSFKFVCYNFRQNITLDNAGIILQGRAKLKLADHKGYQFDKYGVMLPNLTYQVTSSHIKIMIIVKNESQNIVKKASVFHKKHHSRISHPKNMLSMIQSPFNNSFSCVKQNNFVQRQHFSRDKDLEKIVKQSQNYSIISSTLYRKNLSYARSQNIIKNTKNKKQNRYKSPLILFQIVNNKSRLAIPNFCDSQNNATSPTTRQNSKYIQSQQKTIDENHQKAAFLHKVKLSSKQYASLIQKYGSRQAKQNYLPKKKIVLPQSSHGKLYIKQLQLLDLHQNFERYDKNPIKI